MGTTNKKSILGLTLGILSIILPLIGLILGIIGNSLSKKSIAEIDNSNEKGKGLAKSGRICSIIGIWIQSILILLMAYMAYIYYMLITGGK